MFYLIISKNIQGVWMCRQPKKTLVGTTDRVNFTEEESACNAGDPGSIPGSERSTGEGVGYPLQYPAGESHDCVVRAVAESDTTERLSLSHVCEFFHLSN